MASSPLTPSADSRTRVSALREALATRVVVADGAMGTMLQAQDPTLEDFENLEGCNEILNVTRPDIVRSVHDAYFAVGVDCVETNTFGSNHTAASEYDIADRVHELSEAGARIAREAADEHTARDGRQRWVLGSVGPGTKLPTLGHIDYATIRDGYQANVEGLLMRRRRRPDRRDHAGPPPDEGLRTGRPPRAGGHRRRCAAGRLHGLRDHRHHAARLRDRRRADRAGAAGHRHDRPELLDRSGRDERAPALPRPAFPHPAAVHAERGPAHPHQGGRALPARPRGPGRRPGELRPRLRPLPDRRLLRHHPRTPAPGRRAGPRAHALRAHPAARTRRRLPLPDGPLPPGHLLPGDRRADQRQRLEEVPRGHAGGPLGRLCGDGPRADPRGRPHAGPLRGLRGP